MELILETFIQVLIENSTEIQGHNEQKNIDQKYSSNYYGVKLNKYKVKTGI